MVRNAGTEPSLISFRQGFPPVKTAMARKLGGRIYGILAMAMLIVALNSGKAKGESYVLQKKNVRVAWPDYIRGAYDSAVGNFGIPRHAGSVMGSVAYIQQNRKGCWDFDRSIKFRPGEFPTILLVDRGDCFISLKVWNAEKVGAAAVLVSDDREEPLITLNSPDSSSTYEQNITIPSAVIEKNLGDKLKDAISKGDKVNIYLDWRDFVPQIDERVKYDLWINDNHDWGLTSEMQMKFVKNFKGVAQILEKNGYTQFTPHYITWHCPEAFTLSKQCKAQCINHGRYCALDFEGRFGWGFSGKDVVIENLRQLCVFHVAKEDNRPWVWWDYVTDFNTRCHMAGEKYIRDLADSIIKSLGLDGEKIEKCMGDPNADVENFVLEAQRDTQIGWGSRGAVTIIPSLFINDKQYRGTLDKGNVLKAICSGFEETIKPVICFNDDMKTDECLLNNGGCWEDKKENITACKDTSRGRVCKCPLVEGVQLQGDGYTYCDVPSFRVQKLSLLTMDKQGHSSV